MSTLYAVQLYNQSFFDDEICFCFTDYKKQVLANLANFAYDPINYECFRKLNVLDLFLDVLAEEKDECMIEFAMGGICNCCLDRMNQEFLIQNGAIAIISQHLSSSQEETVLSALATLVFMITSQNKSGNNMGTTDKWAVKRKMGCDLGRQFVVA